MKTLITRRCFLQLGGLALSAGVIDQKFLKVPLPRGYETEPLALGRVTTQAIYVYTEPSFKSERVTTLRRDSLVSLLEIVRSAAGPAHNPVWYRIQEGCVHSGRIQWIDPHPDNPPLPWIPETGIYAEVTAPFGHVYRFRRGYGWQRLYRLHYSSVHWITGLDEGPDGHPWYRLRDTLVGVDYHFPAAHLRPIPYGDFHPTARDVPAEAKRIVISIDDQTLTAYEGERAVLKTQVSSGLPDNPFFNTTGIPTETPRGNFHIQFKTPSRHMGDGNLTDDPEAYELPGVPWTMVFHEDGIALHGTYWHNNFGARMSHGCVNLRNQDALWLFRWTEPVYTPVDWYARGSGTLVQVV